MDGPERRLLTIIGEKIALILNMWFTENFKSITLKQTLTDAFDDLKAQYKNPVNDFYGDYKMFMIAGALMNKNIGYDEKFIELMERQLFVN